MRYIAICRHILVLHFGATSYASIAAAYNEGPGNVIRGRPDQAYVSRWEAAQRKWAFVDAQAAAEPAGALPTPTDLPMT